MQGKRALPNLPRYAAQRQLGRGGTGSVYLARDRLAGGRQVALKICHDAVTPEHFLREFRVLRQLRHPHIARAFDFGRLPESGQTYFTTEYVTGATLEEEGARLRKTGASFEPFVRAFLQISQALAYLHRRGLLHLDIKPANVILSRAGVKLIDFGLFQNVHSQDVRRTRGTAYYTAPEVFDGGRVDCRTDLYSLGVTLYRVLTGSYPITGRSLDDIAQNHRETPPRRPRGLPEDLARILMKLLAKAPAHRFQKAEELERALLELCPGGAADVRVRFEDPEFVGRKRELDVFFAWLKGVSSGEGTRLLSVVGEPGAGKSRFLEACETEMSGQGVLVVSNVLSAARRQDDLGLIIERLATLNPLSSRQRSRYRLLLTCVGLSSSRSSQRELRPMSLDQIRARVFAEAVQLLGEMASQPVAILLEDLHQCSDFTQDFVRFFSAQEWSPESRLGLLVTARADTEAERQLANVKTGRSIRLPGLAARDLRRALADFAPELDRRRVSRIVADSGGNPGLLVQLAYQARERTSGFSPAPESYARFLRQRLEALDGAERRVALHLGLLEGPAREGFLRDVTGLPVKGFRSAVHALTSAGLLRRNRDGYYLPQDLLGDRAFRGSDPHEIRDAHQRLGMRLLKERRVTSDAARHLLRGGQTEEGLLHARISGAELADAGRVEEALTLYEQSLEYARRELRADLLERVGDLQERCGRFDGARDSYQRLLGEDDVSPRDLIRIRRKLGGVHQRSGDGAAALNEFDRALELLEEVDYLDEHLHVLNELAALRLFRGEFPRSSTFANRGLELLRSQEAADLEPRTRSLHSLNLHAVSGHILLRQFEYDRATEQFQRSLKDSERVGARSDSALILNNLGVAYHQGNRLKEARQVYKRAASLARQMGDDTALFSIDCNVAGIRARLGQVQAAVDGFRTLEQRPHPRRSKRVRLFFLHTRGLVERLALRDAQSLWNESIQLAEELPDPLFASYGRVYLFENEIFQGRWEAARRVGAEFEEGETDGRLQTAVDCRAAYLESLCGDRALAASLAHRSLARSRAGADPSASPHYGELWDWVLAASALIEVGEVDEAREWLERANGFFERSRQPPGVLECALLLTELEIRVENAKEAERSLRRARRALAQHDTSSGSRAAAVRIPFLEARLEMRTGRQDRASISDRLVDAGGHVPSGSNAEVAWLLDLVAAECDLPGARRKADEALARFLKGLGAADREAYRSTDHRRRLGFEPASSRDRGPTTEAWTNSQRRWRCLASLRRCAEPAEALDQILDEIQAERGAIFLRGSRQIVAARVASESERARLERLRSAALRTGYGPLKDGFCVEIADASRPGLGVLYMEPYRHSEGESSEFLPLAGQLLVGVLAAPSRPRSYKAADTPLKDSSKTRTLLAASLGASESPRIQELMKLVHRTRDSLLPVLVTGESGVGKDYFVRWIHSTSQRKDGPFLGLDCSAIPHGLLEAELFGHEPGAFTDAHAARKGCLVAAQGGTVYLDNVDLIPGAIQAKLVRVLEEKRLRPLGGSAELPIDVRFLASTQRDLKELCGRGEFRKDLYFRLAGICITIPPLRERIEDLPLLVKHFRRQMPGVTPEFSSGAMRVLKEHSWPGNIRELESLVRRLALTVEGPVGAEEVLHALGVEDSQAGFPRWFFDGRSYSQVLDEVKREYLLYLFDRFEGDIARIAREVGSTKRNVYMRFSQAGLRPGDLRLRRPER